MTAHFHGHLDVYEEIWTPLDQNDNEFAITIKIHLNIIVLLKAFFVKLGHSPSLALLKTWLMVHFFVTVMLLHKIMYTNCQKSQRI